MGSPSGPLLTIRKRESEKMCLSPSLKSAQASNTTVVTVRCTAYDPNLLASIKFAPRRWFDDRRNSAPFLANFLGRIAVALGLDMNNLLRRLKYL